jgi:hypothetical protein
MLLSLGDVFSICTFLCKKTIFTSTVTRYGIVLCFCVEGLINLKPTQSKYPCKEMKGILQHTVGRRESSKFVNELVEFNRADKPVGFYDLFNLCSPHLCSMSVKRGQAQLFAAFCIPLALHGGPHRPQREV